VFVVGSGKKHKAVCEGRCGGILVSRGGGGRRVSRLTVSVHGGMWLPQKTAVFHRPSGEQGSCLVSRQNPSRVWGTIRFHRNQLPRTPSHQFLPAPTPLNRCCVRPNPRTCASDQIAECASDQGKSGGATHTKTPIERKPNERNTRESQILTFVTQSLSPGSSESCKPIDPKALRTEQINNSVAGRMTEIRGNGHNRLEETSSKTPCDTSLLAV
jgi:hypothetical protein